MDQSLFTRLFIYRQRDGISPIENFLTESFAFCLEQDNIFRKDFLREIGIKYNSKNEFKIWTQNPDADFGRPDIAIKYDDTFILIESKVESIERTNQLEDYSRILLKDETSKKKHLIYLTKYYDNKEFSHNQVGFGLIRWCDIYRIIKPIHHPITLQLQKYLKENDMAMVKNFTLQDFIVIKNKKETERKMDELLNYIRPLFVKNFGSFNTYSDFGVYEGGVWLKYNSKNYWIGVGFFCQEEEEIPYIELYIFLPQKKFENSEIVKTLTSEFKTKKDWEHYNDWVGFGVGKPISEFFGSNDDNIPAMKKFVEKHLNTLVSLKRKYPKYFKRAL